MSCSHRLTFRGADVPLRWGSCCTEVCSECRAFKLRNHHWQLKDSMWRPVCEYEEAIREMELD